MLILTRRVGETIMIGDNIQVTVLGVRGYQVRVGVNAPTHVPVHREEIAVRIQAERLAESDDQIGSSTLSLEKQSPGRTQQENGDERDDRPEPTDPALPEGIPQARAQ